MSSNNPQIVIVGGSGAGRLQSVITEAALRGVELKIVETDKGEADMSGKLATLLAMASAMMPMDYDSRERRKNRYHDSPIPEANDTIINKVVEDSRRKHAEKEARRAKRFC